MTDVMTYQQDQEENVEQQTMRRVTSLYVHNPYGIGSMVRLAGDKLRKAAEGITITINTVDDEACDQQDQLHNDRDRFLASPACSSNGLSACDSSVMSDDPHSASESHSGERRRRQKKPRKNRSAGLAGEDGKPVSVCLDYLKGVCNRKRSRCKFAHPQLSLDAPAPVQQQCGVAAPAHVRVCEVWALTGFCKFGSRCRDYHPAVEEPVTKVCAPATTQRMTTASREAARRLSGCSWSEDSSDEGMMMHRSCTPPPPALHPQQPSPVHAAPAAPACMQSWWEVDALLFHLTSYNFDATLKRLVCLLTMPMSSGLTVEALLPMLFGKAIENYERLASLSAMLCRNLCDLYPEAQRHEFQCQLLRLADRVLHLTPDGSESDEQLVNMARKQRGTAAFLGELFKQSLVPAVRLQSALDYCTKRAQTPADDGQLYSELACMLLNNVGHAAAGILDLDQTVKQLREAVAMHQQRYQPMYAQF